MLGRYDEKANGPFPGRDVVPLIEIAARRYGLDLEEFQQEAVHHLRYAMLPKFDDERGYSWGAYARTGVARLAITMHRYRLAQKRGSGQVVSLTAISEDILGGAAEDGFGLVEFQMVLERLIFKAMRREGVAIYRVLVALKRIGRLSSCDINNILSYRDERAGRLVFGDPSEGEEKLRYVAQVVAFVAVKAPDHPFARWVAEWVDVEELRKCL